MKRLSKIAEMNLQLNAKFCSKEREEFSNSISDYDQGVHRVFILPIAVAFLMIDFFIIFMKSVICLQVLYLERVFLRSKYFLVCLRDIKHQSSSFPFCYWSSIFNCSLKTVGQLFCYKDQER